MGSALGGSSFSISGSGKVSDAAILKILEKNMQKFQYCYEKALLKNASLAGQLTMEWTIETSGSTTHVKVVKSQLNNGSLHQCMNTELSRISFPNPKGGAVIVKYPFAFSSSQI